MLGWVNNRKPTHAPMKTNPLKWKLHWQIALALAVAFGLGIMLRQTGNADGAFAEQIKAACAFMGTLFMRALKMVVVPLIVSSIICGIMSLGAQRNFGRVGLKTLLYYAGSGLVAILIGLTVVNLIKPGDVDASLAQTLVSDTQHAETIAQKVEKRGAGEMLDIFLRMVPPNIFEAATDNGQLLGLITFSLLFGYFIHKLPNNLRETQERFWNGVVTVMLHITEVILRFAPIGIFGLVTPTVLEQGQGILGPLAWFFLTVMLALGLHMFIALPLALKCFAGVSPIKHLHTMAPVMLTAFSTASSSSTLPLTLETVEKQSGVSNATASFTLPLGATVNMDGTALYECVVVIFIAQIYASISGVAFGLVDQFTVVVLALMTSIGVAGIPAASLVAITVILGVVGLPVEAVGIVWATDRILDMCRTSVNVFSDTCAAVIIARSEGETGVYNDPDTG